MVRRSLRLVTPTARGVPLSPQLPVSLVDRAQKITKAGRLIYAIEAGEGIAEPPPLQRDWLGELLDGLGNAPADVDWLLSALAAAEPKERFETDPLADALSGYVASLPPSSLAALLEGISKLLNRKPVVEQRNCEISKRYSWLGQAAGQIVMKMIQGLNAETLKKPALSVLRKLPLAEDYDRSLFEEIRKDIPELVQAWPELNRALFWYRVAEERARKRKSGERLTDYWLVSIFGSYWAFGGPDFEYVAEQITGHLPRDHAGAVHRDGRGREPLRALRRQLEWRLGMGQISPDLLPALLAKRLNTRNLGYLLAIINRSSVDDKTIAAIASRKANATRNLTFSPIWFATWVGVDPDAAIPALAARFAGMNDPAEQTKLALAFVVALLGGRSQEGRARQAFRAVEHMKSLYLLMARYIRQDDDIQRAGKGVYLSCWHDRHVACVIGNGIPTRCHRSSIASYPDCGRRRMDLLHASADGVTTLGEDPTES